MYRFTNRRLLKVALVVSLCLLLVLNINAQDKCDPEATLTQANDEFNAGHFYGLPMLLEPCLTKNGFTREQLVRAYQLLTQTYLILEDHAKAETCYLKLLEANPEYESNTEKDPIDVVYLSRKFTATPIFSWFVQASANLAVPRVIRYHSAFQRTEQSYSLTPRWSLGGGIIWNANDRWTLESGLSFSNSVFKFRETGIFIYDELNQTENQLSLTLPLSVKYTYIRKGISPYGYAGVSAGLLLSAKQSFTFNNRTPNYNNNDVIGFAEQAVEGEQNVRFRRDLINRSFHIGTGFRWKYRLDYFFVDLRYSFGINNIVKQSSLVRDIDEPGSDAPVFSVGYVDNYMRLDQIFVSVGYIKPLYKPRKLKRARTKNVLRDIKRDDDEENK